MDQTTKYSNWVEHSSTTAREFITVANNGTWSDAYQFDDPDDRTWTLDGQSFELDVQRNPYDTAPLLSCSTSNGRIIIDDVVQRVIHMNVAPDDIQAALDPGVYVYDLVMLDGTGVRVPLMHGTLTIVQGVTFPP